MKKMVKIKKSLDRQPQKKDSSVIAKIIHRETKKPWARHVRNTAFVSDGA
jgi:hypothetical protein